MTTIDTITDEQVAELRREARTAGDDATVSDCDLVGAAGIRGCWPHRNTREALARIVEVIRDAERVRQCRRCRGTGEESRPGAGPLYERSSTLSRCSICRGSGVDPRVAT
jgi:hypothetical protein